MLSAVWTLLGPVLRILTYITPLPAWPGMSLLTKRVIPATAVCI